jgi:hypothetical protein
MPIRPPVVPDCSPRVSILDPLPHVANHVIQTELVRREGANWSGLRNIPPAAAAGTIGIVAADGVSPRIGRFRPSARRVLVFRFSKQAVGFAGDLGEPCHVALRVVPAHVDRRLAIVSPSRGRRPASNHYEPRRRPTQRKSPRTWRPRTALQS